MYTLQRIVPILNVGSYFKAYVKSHTYAMYSMWTPEQQGSGEQIAAGVRLNTARSLYICARLFRIGN